MLVSNMPLPISIPKLRSISSYSLLVLTLMEGIVTPSSDIELDALTLILSSRKDLSKLTLPLNLFYFHVTE